MDDAAGGFQTLFAFGGIGDNCAELPTVTQTGLNLTTQVGMIDEDVGNPGSNQLSYRVFNQGSAGDRQ